MSDEATKRGKHFTGAGDASSSQGGAGDASPSHDLLERLIRLVYGAFLVAILVAAVVIAPGRDYPHKRNILVPSSMLLAVGAVLAAVTWAFLRSARGRQLCAVLEERRATADKVVLVSVLVLAVLQLLSVHSYVFETGWDSEGIKWSAWSLAHREGFYVEYFSTYPNNLLLLRLAQLCTLVSLRLGATEPGAAIEVFAVINVISCSVALLLVYGILSRVSSVVSGVIGLVLAVLLLWTSPWVSIMYSDALLLGLPPVAIALLMSSRGRKPAIAVLALLAFGFVVGIGYQIKPQMIFLLLALVGMGAVELVESAYGRTLERKTVLVKLGRVSCVVAGVALAVALGGFLTRGLKAQLDESRQFGAEHFLMMGLNPEARGDYSQSDVNFSKSYATREERRAADLAVVRERLVELGPAGLAGLFLDKALTNFNDGTFAWGQEGMFFNEGPHGDDLLAPLTRSLYYEDGSLYFGFVTYEHLVWLTTLLLCTLSLFGSCLPQRASDDTASEATPSRESSRERRYLVTYMTLVLIMLSCFELVFEARARYLYAFATVFVMLAAMAGARQRNV